MIKKSVIPVLAFLLLVALATTADEGRLLRYPDYENGTIVFTYQNDLWVVPESGGVARRLTVFNGIEDHPKFSPDGKWIAFNGQYKGDTNVYLMSAEGGEPKQLTFHPDDTSVVEWSPDGSKVLYTSGRASFVRFFQRFFEVPLKGGPSQVLPIDSGSLAAYSPDDSTLVFNRHPYRFWWWKRYKGSQNADLWKLDRKSGNIEQLTDWQGTDRWPMWGADGKIYFVSEREGLPNIFTFDLASKAIAKVTNHRADGVQWPSIDSKGGTIVYECEGKLWLLKTASGESTEVKVTVAGDYKSAMVEWINPYNGFFNYASIGPSGKRVLVDARGEIFSLPVTNGETRNLTNSSGARDGYPVWSPDGKYVAYTSDINGEYEIYIVDQRADKPPVKLTTSGEFKFNLVWSPDSKKLLYTNNERELILVDVAAKSETKVAGSKYSSPRQYTWSPDSKWITYMMPQRNPFNHIAIYNIEKAEVHKVTDGAANEGSPVFDPAGKYLYFLSSGRNFSANFNLVSQGPVPQTTVMAISLSPEKKTPFKLEDDEEPIVEEKKEEAKKPESDKAGEKAKAPDKMKKDAAKKVDVTIDFEGIVERVRRLPIAPGNYSSLGITKSHLYYIERAPQGRSGKLVAWDFKKQKATDIVKSLNGYELNAKGTKILVLAQRKISVIDAGRPAKPGSGAVKTNDMMMKLDRRAEWKQMFNETFRMIRDFFYDEKLHGIDLKSLKSFYESLLPYVKTRADLTTLLQEIVGELNASHQGVGGGDMPAVPRVNVAMLGAELEPDTASGLYKFSKIYRGDKTQPKWRAPLDADFVKIKEGDFLLRINGKDVKADDDYVKYLVGVNGKITLTTNSEPKTDGAIETTIEPLNSRAMSSLRHFEWISKNREMVEKASDGKIGYVHITGMTGPGLQEFMQAVREFRFKDGLILDVRFNGGGGIDPILIDVLERRAYQVTRNRDAAPDWRPNSGFYGHVTVLINEHSYSDAEVFPNAFRVRKLGKVIGVPTLGFVIAVGPYPMIDNGSVRRTGTGLWDVLGNQLESRGALPDIEVRNLPGDVVKGKDAQLEAAIKHLMEQIAAHPVPRPEDMKQEIKPR